MTGTVVQLKGSEFAEGMAFLDMVFGEHRPHDFAGMLPSIYQPTDEHMGHNYAVKVDGQIQGIVGMFPMVWKVGDAVLKVAGIGGVSTHPEARGKGYMRTLMDHCVGLMREQGYHLSWLGGQRQRYLYFGYEKCGSGRRFTLNKSNLRHAFIGPASLRFEPLTEDGGRWLEQALALHDAQRAHAVRPAEHFGRYLLSWFHKPWVALDGDGEMVGYLVANEAGDQVTELAADNDATALEMAKSWTADHCEGAATFELHPWSVRLGQMLARYCEAASVGGTGNWQILDWLAALDALMKLERRCIPMVPGEAVVEVEGIARVRLWVRDVEAGCEAAGGAPADLTCDAPTAMRALFGPLQPSWVLDLPPAASVLESWCPLPLSWGRQDGV